jgi:putative hydroxymethylpyrimidine transporter CytX
MTYVVFRQYGLSSLLAVKGNRGLPFMLGLDYVIAMPISWLPLVCDYSRYAKENRGSLIGTWLGYFLVSSWMYLIGLAAGLATQSPTPDAMVLKLMASFGLVGVAMFIVLFSTFTTTFLDIYSTSISALNVFPKLGERRGVILWGAIGIVIALVFGEYPETYAKFLEIIGYIFCPLFGVVLADYFIIRNQVIQTDALYSREGYWYTGGIHWVAMVSWGVGAIFFRVGRDLGIGGAIPSFIVAAIVYIVLMRVLKDGQPESHSSPR